VCTSSAPSSIGKSASFLRSAVAGEAGLLLLAWALAHWLNISPLEELRPTLGNLLWGIAAALPLLLGLIWMLTSESGPVRRLVTLVEDQVGALLAGCSMLQLGVLAVVAGACEEILFRGVIQGGMTRWLPEVWALLATSVLFGLVHFASRTYALFAGVMGLYLGSLFLVQGSLLAPIVAHSLYDFIALVYIARAYAPSQRQPRVSA
jgi:uncharacterized protein